MPTWTKAMIFWLVINLFFVCHSNGWSFLGFNILLWSIKLLKSSSGFEHRGIFWSAEQRQRLLCYLMMMSGAHCGRYSPNAGLQKKRAVICLLKSTIIGFLERKKWWISGDFLLLFNFYRDTLITLSVNDHPVEQLGFGFFWCDTSLEALWSTSTLSILIDVKWFS